MCVRIISTRLPVRLLRTFKYGPGTTAHFTYYLTCGSSNFRRYSDTRTTEYGSSRKSLLTSCLRSRGQFLGHSLSTLPKDDTLSKDGIISNIASANLRRSSVPEKVSNQKDECTDDANPKKLGLFARFKLMYKQYWYVLIPVHVVTSIGWFGGFYYLSQSGVDIPALLESLRISETVIDKLRDSTMGHLAIAYLCYKISTPLRYTVTLGGTTVSIKYLEQHGYIKPMPTKSQLMQMYEDKKADRAKRKQERSKDNN